MAIMRGLGQFQQAQMKGVDPRIGQLFHHIREVIDILEQMMLHPHSSPMRDQPLQPPPEVAARTDARFSKAGVYYQRDMQAHRHQPRDILSSHAEQETARGEVWPQNPCHGEGP
jgi:hypothetical protein